MKKKKYNGDYNKHLLNIFLDNRLYNLQLNKFPYDLEKNIIHCVLWLNPIIQDKFINNKKFIYTILKKYIPNKPFLFHMNLPENRSINTIPHYQVFIKMNQDVFKKNIIHCVLWLNPIITLYFLLA